MGEAMKGVKRCSTCQFYEGQECHRYPPKDVTESNDTVWTFVHKDDWCGEYVAMDQVTLFKNMKLGAKA